ncbi:nicotinamide-nucleotide amidohydrolase family protein [Aurantimonas endophytica]|uniref:Nicotinamide-nucleotide amidase n=1 Tax=Aurantimonas endophytica TaxID=1522175 RepID=A0A7W6HAF2_9HYPH|nr:nicotinamide-nucleotide amidase [Aurantimonas endophytica]MCO6402851.1 nicotinamide-nucleotide amidohydrolase family protein [Aurantimonas endophytica]
MSGEAAKSSLVAAIVERYAAANGTIATAESCTGGMVAAALTDIAGSSVVFDRGFVTYSNAAKMAMLGVGEATLATFGAVSEETAREMAEGARSRSGVDVAVSITGIAGPGGGSATKPVGLVHFACAGPAGTSHRKELFGDPGRAAIRLASTVVALEMLLEALPG